LIKNTQAVGKDRQVYNNMESAYVAGNNMLHDFESMLKKDGHTDQDLIKLINADNRDPETSKLVDSKEKSNTKEASSEELDPAREEFFAQLSKKLKLSVEVCKKGFEEELDTDDEAKTSKDTSKTAQNKNRDKFMDAFAKAYNPKNTQQTGGLLNKLDKKMELKAVIKKFAKKYKLNPKAIKKSLKLQIKQAGKSNNLINIIKPLKLKPKIQSIKTLAVQGVNAVLNPRPTPPKQTPKQQGRAF
jgi:hypothetical protein